MPEPLMSARGVTRRFGDFTAVDNVSLEVAPGEVVGLLGANGAGKTTLIRMILGLLIPTEGDLSLFGQAPSRETRARLGYVSQGLGLWDDLTVTENLAFVDGAFGSAQTPVPDSLRGAGDSLVVGIGLGGQRQLAFAAALGHKPELLVLDEPTSGVDPLARARLWDTVRDQADAGVGALVTTHYMQEAERCDRLMLMSRGVAVAQGTVKDIVGNTTATEVRTQHWQQAFTALNDANILVALAGTHVRAVDASEDDVRAALGEAGVKADLVPMQATLDEAMVARERATA
ncbi:ABC transporter ATP-binding protein [Demequina aurantiaca]|uniref:ABC transporter ATP-binding protein n=1 Tax=Demequina aurantiaca TaxID=676200 RepID=UPI000780650C|nr:ABC transporter ATP-binding protein [Demequina aurantiaca]